MAQIGARIVEAKAERRRFSPAGQSTQVIVGADATTDEALIRKSAHLYDGVGLKRVYYSAFSPIPDGAAILPLKPPPLQREHRLYQADWLLRYYHFTPDDVADAAEDGMLALDKIVKPRRHATLRLDDVARLTSGLKRARPFLIAADHRPVGLTDRLDLRARLVEPARQLSLF